VSTLSAQVHPRTPEERARRQARYLTGLLWHAGSFLIINAFFWIIDFGLGKGGPHWAFWITGVWGFALAFHALAYAVAGRGVEERRYARVLEGSRRRQAGRQ
jgi:hypothetical protein